ncbi:hypothetical protein X975_26602, partial [Stegodyphus mimosarum]
MDEFPLVDGRYCSNNSCSLSNTLIDRMQQYKGVFLFKSI